jgi:hypothetical protein
MHSYHFVAILQWYIDRKNSDVKKMNEEARRAGTSEKMHVGADGSLEATALWKRYLIDFALSETQVLILYVFTESECVIYFDVLLGESLSLISLTHTSNHTYTNPVTHSLPPSLARVLSRMEMPLSLSRMEK